MHHDNYGYHYTGHDDFSTMSVESQEEFKGTCGFIKLKERHKVKAIMKRVTNEEQVS